MKVRRTDRQFQLLAVAVIITFLWYFTYVVFNKEMPSNTEENVVNKKSTLPKEFSVFDVLLNSQEKNILMDTLLAFKHIMDSSNLTYFLYGGSLLGAYRHGGMIPWDDDVDVLINNSQSDLLKQQLDKMRDYKLSIESNSHWKMFSVLGSQVENKPYKWPFIDILKFNENETHVWDSLEQYKNLFVYQKSDVFPLKKCRFETLYLNVPRHIEKAMGNNYDPEICSSAKFDHKNNQPIKQQRLVIPCKQLNSYYQLGSYCK